MSHLPTIVRPPPLRVTLSPLARRLTDYVTYLADEDVEKALAADLLLKRWVADTKAAKKIRRRVPG